MDKLIFAKGKLVDNRIETDLGVKEIAGLLKSNKIVIIRGLFASHQLRDLRHEVALWAEATEPVSKDDFKGNYHCKRVRVSNIQGTPHIFHDYNFNNFDMLPSALGENLLSVFDPLRAFYNSLMGFDLSFGFIEGAPYLHPQLIQYPVGGGFFGRHSHNLNPQQIGFILSLSKYGADYKGGGTCFIVDDETLDIEGHQDEGDLVLWPNNLDHWVKQSPLDDWFSWDYDKGRWVATLAYFNPY